MLFDPRFHKTDNGYPHVVARPAPPRYIKPKQSSNLAIFAIIIGILSGAITMVVFL